jgi:nicotinate-nucleotide adenylyltransferase
MGKRLGLMGGTFDPIHHGHLAIAEVARVEYGLDRVVFIPAGDPPHKQGLAVTPAERRYEMALLATASNPCFECSRRELDREGPSYAVTTIREYRAEGGPDQELFFITGADAILEILTWHEADAVVQLCRFIAATRPGYDLERLRGALPPAYLERIDFLDAPGLQISSTDLRRRVRDGRPIRYLVPELVEAYIRKGLLYRDERAFDDRAGKSDGVRAPSPLDAL